MNAAIDDEQKIQIQMAIDSVVGVLRWCMEGENTIYPEVNLIDVAARLRGRLLLEPGGEMTIYFGSKRYKIKRQS